MKISICIPQYNRINFLLENLKQISTQDYNNFEVVISDDCSTDNTEEKIQEVIKNNQYSFPIIYHRNDTNIGYSANLRKSMELSNGEYCFILGNDDTPYKSNSISKVASYLKEFNYPDLGFCNFIETDNINKVVSRASETKLIGSGAEVASRYYNCFSFVGGLIFKKTVFDKFNTAKYDWGVYIQLYLAVKIIINGGVLFSISEPVVLKDLKVGNELRNSYKERLKKKWKDFRIMTGGLPNAAIAAIDGFEDAKNQSYYALKIIKKMYLYTLPFWMLDYKTHGAFVDSIGLMIGLSPRKNKALFKSLPLIKRFKGRTYYLIGSILGIIIPAFLMKYRYNIYAFRRKYLG